MEYCDRYYGSFGLEYNPFQKNSQSRFSHESKDYRETMYKLDYLFSTRGMGVITGNPGVGKTTAVRDYAGRLNKALYKTVCVSMTTLTEKELYRLLIRGFGHEPCFRKSDNYRLLQSIIQDLNNRHMVPVIIIDEADCLSRVMLNDLRMIFNFGMDSIDSYVLLDAWLPVLSGTLQAAQHEPLRQRLIFEYGIGGLEGGEVRDCIHSKIGKAGGSASIIGPNAIQAAANYSKGIPRVIDRIMDYALLIAHNAKSTSITPEIMEKAIGQFR